MSESGLARQLTQELFDLSIAMDLVGNATAGRLGINQTDLICLHLLVHKGPLSAGEVAAALGLTAAAISAMAARLERGGYARREIDPSDRRRILLHASEPGVQRAFSLFDGLYAASTELASTYSERSVRMLVRLLAEYRQLLARHADTVRPAESN